jgi:hypothetical protein
MKDGLGLGLLLLVGVGGFYLYVAYGFANLGAPQNQTIGQGVNNLFAQL